LALAHEQACERALDGVLQQSLETGQLPDLKALQARFRPASAPPPTVDVQLPAAAIYDQLLPAQGAWS